MEPLPRDVVALLEKPNPAVVATVRRDGAPVSAAVWYLWDDGDLLLTMGAASPRRSHLQRDRRLTLTVLDAAGWYRQVTLHGEVVELADDPDRAVIDRLSRHYDGRDFADAGQAHAFARVRVVGWNTFGI
ncbi:TIGR03618 family F420-dependent PPOX class oxidoreductase [Amnibacterium endophyticum]|uniref:TIGR03618 family F420-dependent PPOX class oxidoreductase n=1 Tax=Amnibacterium endophyticum TaxID=2109337 RepID=A0ABW4LFM1_9MICO